MADLTRLSNIPLPEPNLATIAAGVALHRARPWRVPGPRPVQRLVGCLLIAAGVGVIARSWAAAGRVDLAAPGQLVTSGPYAFSRNPMYAGWSLLQLGVGVATGSAWIIASLPFAAWWIHREVMQEEEWLEEAFEDDFARYRAAVPRYLPGLR